MYSFFFFLILRIFFKKYSVTIRKKTRHSFRPNSKTGVQTQSLRFSRESVESDFYKRNDNYMFIRCVLLSFRLTRYRMFLTPGEPVPRHVIGVTFHRDKSRAHVFTSIVCRSDYTLRNVVNYNTVWARIIGPSAQRKTKVHSLSTSTCNNVEQTMFSCECVLSATVTVRCEDEQITRFLYGSDDTLFLTYQRQLD